MNVDEQRRLVEKLSDPGRYPHPAERVEHRETHSSHVLLAGDYAYKIKKPLDLGFLDYSTLEQRHHYCREELRLNGRLAPLYLDVVAITGTAAEPRVSGDGEAVEWAVRMRRFEEDQQLDRRLAAGTLTRTLIDDLARRVADFHAEATVADAASEYGSPEAVARPMRENFEHIAALITEGADRDRLERVARWTEERLAAAQTDWERRRANGRIRECHGDMHLANMVALPDRLAIFDGIEFNAQLRWIDVASEIAFVVMDLDSGDAPALAGRFLDQWLASSGDYDALTVLQPYLVYRAMVRAKTAAIRLGQGAEAGEAESTTARLRRYLALANRYAAARAPAVVITRGVAGSGKSTAAAMLVERLGAIRIRADVERRRLYPDADPENRYSDAAHDAVYARLEALAAAVAEAGYPVVVDATFLERARRAPFERLAADRGIPFRILDMQAPLTTIEQRLAHRQRSGGDPSEADRQVMMLQWERLEPLSRSETEAAITVNNAGDAPAVATTGLLHARGQAEGT